MLTRRISVLLHPYKPRCITGEKLVEKVSNSVRCSVSFGRCGESKDIRHVLQLLNVPEDIVGRLRDWSS